MNGNNTSDNPGKRLRQAAAPTESRPLPYCNTQYTALYDRDLESEKRVDEASGGGGAGKKQKAKNKRQKAKVVWFRFAGHWIRAWALDGFAVRELSVAWPRSRLRSSAAY